jgi:glycosyltransferase involved in cell wall biosynthesis
MNLGKPFHSSSNSAKSPSKTLRVAIVSKLYPETHYTIFLGKALQAAVADDRIQLLFYRSIPESNRVDLNNSRKVWSQNIFYPFEIFRQVAKDKPDIVHIQHEFNMFGGYRTVAVFPVLLLLLRLARAKTVITLHAVVPPSMVNPEFARVFGASSRLWIFLRLAMWITFRTSISLSSSIIVHANILKTYLERGYDAPPEKIQVIPIGVPEAYTKFAEHSKWKSLLSGKKIILFFGYLTERKDVTSLIRAFRKLSIDRDDLRLVIVGGILSYSSPYVDKLRSTIIALGIEDKVMLDTRTPFPAEELHELYELADVFVLPYSLSISSSLVLSFALQHRKPVVAADTPVLRELIIAGQEGLLYTGNDDNDLSRSIERLIKDEEFRQNCTTAMGRKAEELSWSNVAETTLRVYMAVSRDLGF